jgi:glyoxylase-like metal-dependent hydrolase (beta-lactamase superfamily II)
MSVRRWGLFVAGAGFAAAGLLGLRPAASEVNQVKELASGVYFHEGDLTGKGHCNNGWIVLQDYVLVVDANFPSGAQVVIPKIKALTKKPIRFAFDTHHHGDHAYGNQVWVDEGAVPIANSGVLKEMKKYETGFYGGKPGRWEDSAKTRPDVAASKLHPPSLLFPKELVFDDGKERVELKYLGVAHTHGDGWAWLPKERILFSGDACVNGPYNYVGDGNIGEWISTLDAAKRLNPKVVCPGHGQLGDGSLLEDQRQFFVELQRQGRMLYDAHKSPSDAQAEVERIRKLVERNSRIKKYVGEFFAAQLEKAYTEAGGRAFPMKAGAEAHREHAGAHNLNLLELGPPMRWHERTAKR